VLFEATPASEGLSYSFLNCWTPTSALRLSEDLWATEPVGVSGVRKLAAAADRGREGVAWKRLLEGEMREPEGGPHFLRLRSRPVVEEELLP
jgi:hypothetical protein